jgi:hypothetical protein
MRPPVAHCHLGLGKLYRHTGNREQARERLSNATAMYREMDMPFWLEKAESPPLIGQLHARSRGGAQTNGNDNSISVARRTLRPRPRL